MAEEPEADRVGELEEAIEKIRAETFKPKQTLPQLRHAITLILQDVKD